MKKILLSIAAGMLMLALPVIASAAAINVGTIFDQYFNHSVHHPQSLNTQAINNNSFDQYSGYTAQITVRGFKLYSTSTGKNAGFKRFSWTEKANKAVTGRKNTWAQMSTVNNAGGPSIVYVWLNAHTIMEIVIANAIAPANGKAVRANAIYLVVRTSGDMTLDSGGNQNIPDGFGLTATQDIIEGSCTITAYNNPTTHNMVLSIATPAAIGDETQTYTSVSGTPYYWNQTGASSNWVVAPTGYPSMTSPAVSISPIRLKPTSGSGYSGPWWNLNTGGLFF
jgi:hypothetical protein